MKEQITKILNTFSAFWKAQEKKRKLLYIGGLAALVFFVVLIAIFANIKHYAVLYEGLDSKDSTAIMSELATMGVVGRLENSGTTITVPDENVSKARMDLAVLGYPKNPLNYEIIDSKVNMFSTDSDRRNAERMQAQERAMATLKTLDGVEDAIVTFYIPQQKDTVITVNVKPSSASVVVRLRDGYSPSEEQVSGMYNTVRTSISGLTNDTISIVDGAGNPLVIGVGRPEDVVAQERNKLRFKQELETTITDGITKLLTPIFNTDFNVVANALLNYDKTVGEDTKYTPSNEDGSGMISQEDERNSSGTDGAGDVVGATPNADGTYPTQQGGTGGAYSDNEKSTTYLVNTAKTQIEKQGYKIDALTISVATYMDTFDEEKRAELITAVARAGGITEADVSFVNMPKIGNNNDIATSTFPFGMSRNMFFLLMAALLVMIIIFTVMYMGVSKKARRKRRAIEQQIYDAALAAGGAGKVDGFFGADQFVGRERNSIKVESLSEHSADQSDTVEAAVRKEIGEFAKNSPEIVGALLKSWLREEDESGGSSHSGGGRGSGRR